MTPLSRAPRMPSRAVPAATALRAAGITCVVLAITMFTLGLLIFVSGYEVAFVLMVFGLGVFVLAIGLLAAACGLS